MRNTAKHPTVQDTSSPHININSVKAKKFCFMLIKSLTWCIFKHNSTYLKGIKDNSVVYSRRVKRWYTQRPYYPVGKTCLYSPWLYFRTKSLPLPIISKILKTEENSLVYLNNKKVYI